MVWDVFKYVRNVLNIYVIVKVYFIILGWVRIKWDEVMNCCIENGLCLFCGSVLFCWVKN